MNKVGTFSVGDRKIRYVVKRSRSSSYAHLKLRNDLSLQVTIPEDSDVNVKELLEKKQAWIEKKLEEVMGRRPVFDNGRVLFKGKYYDIGVKDSPKSKAGAVEIAGSKMTVFIGGDENPEDTLREWMKEKTTNYARRKVRRSVREHGISVGRMLVKDTKRWGYCRRNGDIVLNWQLIALPRKLAEYVILHELAHISEFSHSKEFRKRLAAMCPDYGDREEELKEYVASEPAISAEP